MSKHALAEKVNKVAAGWVEEIPKDHPCGVNMARRKLWAGVQRLKVAVALLKIKGVSDDAA